MDNPVGYRANHRPSVCLQPSVGRRVSTACLINDTDHQYLESNHQTRLSPSLRQYLPMGKTSFGISEKIEPVKISKTKMPKSQKYRKSILRQFANNLCSRETVLFEGNWMSRHSFLHLFQNNISRSTMCNRPIT